MINKIFFMVRCFITIVSFGFALFILIQLTILYPQTYQCKILGDFIRFYVIFNFIVLGMLMGVILCFCAMGCIFLLAYFKFSSYFNMILDYLNMFMNILIFLKFNILIYRKRLKYH